MPLKKCENLGCNLKLDLEFVHPLKKLFPYPPASATGIRHLFKLLPINLTRGCTYPCRVQPISTCKPCQLKRVY